MNRRDFLKSVGAAGLAASATGALVFPRPPALAKADQPMKEAHMEADTILHNAKIATNGVPSFVEAIAIKDGRISAAGTNDEIMRQRGPGTQVIDVGGRTVIPGLNDSHMHPIRGGLNYNMELRWDGVPSLSDASAHAERASRSNSTTAVGQSDRRMDGVPVCRAPHADS